MDAVKGLDEFQDMPVDTSVVDVIRRLDDVLGDSADVVKRQFTIRGEHDIDCVFYCVDGLVNTDRIDKQLLQPLFFDWQEDGWANEPHVFTKIVEVLQRKGIPTGSMRPVKTYDEVLLAILSGDTALFVNHSAQALILSTRGWDARSVGEPQTELVVRGPRDGFNESMRTNTALLRRRIRDPKLRIESMNIGTQSQTDVSLCFIKGLTKDSLIDEVRQRLKRIEINAVLESGYIEELIADAPRSPFNTILCTERPDKVAAALMEGRVAIVVDNTPFVLVAPTTFWEFLHTSDDYYSNYYLASFSRMIRFVAFLISLTLPSLYIMLITFHQEMIPTQLALSIAAGRESVPFPGLFEILIMEIVFELLREAGIRMPRAVGQAVSIVGSLVIGQTAVQAGLVSPLMIIVVALTGICSFAVPNYAASFTMRLMRFPLLIASGTLGLLGFTAVMFGMMVHVLSLRSFGESYMTPLIPFHPTDQKDSLVRSPWWNMAQMPTVASGNKERMGKDQMPEPQSDTSTANTSDSGKSTANAGGLMSQRGMPTAASPSPGRKPRQKRTVRKLGHS